MHRQAFRPPDRLCLERAIPNTMPGRARAAAMESAGWPTSG